MVKKNVSFFWIVKLILKNNTLSVIIMTNKKKIVIINRNIPLEFCDSSDK